MFFSRRGEKHADVTLPTFFPSAYTGKKSIIEPSL